MSPAKLPKPAQQPHYQTVDVSSLKGLPASGHPLHQKLVDGPGLLEALFEEESRPSLRWLRQMQSQRKIPYRKIGHLVRFDIEEVRQALESSCTIHPRKR